MGRLPISDDPDLLVGAVTGDDAAVWRIDADRALISTADFITPVVDDARTWGRVAAANAVSDVYAMGGTPLFALNLVAWNTEALPAELLGEVLAGGHTIDDPEPKYGLAVTGECDPNRLLTNTGLRPGDHLVLSKALGIGIITTAIKRDIAPQPVVDAAVASMIRLNDEAARVALEAGATGATDVTGFGLLGHLGRMARESRTDIVIETARVPVVDGARSLAEAGSVPGGTGRNLAYVEPELDRGDTDDLTVTILADAQTSGGLVFGVSGADAADSAVAALRATGHDAERIGRAVEGSGKLTLR